MQNKRRNNFVIYNEEGLNPDKSKYEILITNKDEIGFENVQRVKEAVYEYGCEK